MVWGKGQGGNLKGRKNLQNTHIKFMEIVQTLIKKKSKIRKLKLKN